MPKKFPLTVIIPTGNRMDTIEDCIKSVQWAEEILVIDSFSTDGTVEIAQKYSDRILHHDYGYSALQKNWAIPQSKYEWVLIVDTDERVSEELKNEILKILTSPEVDCVGFRIPRINYFLGEKVLHANYYPDYQIRLFKRDFGKYELRKVHAHVVLDGKCGTIDAPIIHYAHRSVNQTIVGLLGQMTTWEAEQRINEINFDKKNPNKFIRFNLLFRPLAAFLLRYIKQQGWKDGIRGLILSMIWAMYVAITYMKIWEQSLQLENQWWHQDWEQNYGNEAKNSIHS